MKAVHRLHQIDQWQDYHCLVNTHSNRMPSAASQCTVVHYYSSLSPTLLVLHVYVDVVGAVTN